MCSHKEVFRKAIDVDRQGHGHLICAICGDKSPKKRAVYSYQNITTAEIEQNKERNPLGLCSTGFTNTIDEIVHENNLSIEEVTKMLRSNPNYYERDPGQWSLNEINGPGEYCDGLYAVGYENESFHQTFVLLSRVKKKLVVTGMFTNAGDGRWYSPDAVRAREEGRTPEKHEVGNQRRWNKISHFIDSAGNRYEKVY